MKTKLLLCILSFLILSCTDIREKDATLNLSELKTPNVKVVTPILRNFRSELQIIGNALPNKVVDIHAMEGGFLSVLKKDIGDKVKKREILAILNKKGYVSNKITGWLTALIIAMGIVLLGYKIYDVSRRDNMNFDEYKWHFDPSKVEAGEETVWDYDKKWGRREWDALKGDWTDFKKQAGQSSSDFWDDPSGTIEKGVAKAADLRKHPPGAPVEPFQPSISPCSSNFAPV